MTEQIFKRDFTRVRFERLEGRRLLSGGASATLVADSATDARIYYYVTTDAAGGPSWGIAASGEIDPAVYTNYIDVQAGVPVTIPGIPGEITVSPGAKPPTLKPQTPPKIKTAAPASRDASDLEMTLGTVVQADGKVVVATLIGAASANEKDFSGQTFDRISLVRYRADGSIDTTFGNGGATTYSLGTPATSDYWSGSMAADAQGRFLVAYYGGIMRFNADGTVDSSFGSNGTAVAQGTDAMKLQADGKILVLNSSTLSRFNADGTVDASFTPYTLAVPGSRWHNAQLHDFAVAPDGSIYVVGEIRTANEGQDVQMTTGYLTKLDPSGAVDPTFATNGRYELGLPERKWEGLRGVAVLPDGKVQVIGTYSYLTPFENPFDPNDLYRDDSGTVLARFNADGSLDHSFGEAGIVKDKTIAMDDLFGMVVLDDGRIVASTYGNDGARLFVADADGSNRRTVDQRVDIVVNGPTPFDTKTRAPVIAPDGSIVTGVGIADLYNDINRDASKTYWTRFELDDLDSAATASPTDTKAPSLETDLSSGADDPAPGSPAVDAPAVDASEGGLVVRPGATVPLSAFAAIVRASDTNTLGSLKKDDFFGIEADVLA